MWSIPWGGVRIQGDFRAWGCFRTLGCLGFRALGCTMQGSFLDNISRCWSGLVPTEHSVFFGLSPRATVAAAGQKARSTIKPGSVPLVACLGSPLTPTPWVVLPKIIKGSRFLSRELMNRREKPKQNKQRTNNKKGRRQSSVHASEP